MTTSTADRSVKTKNIFGQPLTIFGVPVDRETIFSDHRGVYKNKVEKRQRNLIVKSTFIKFYLHHNERIRCLTTAYTPVNMLEQLLAGPSFLFFKRALLIFTDKRILHVPTRYNRSSRGAISQILYEDCAGLRINGRTLYIKYKNGSQEAFPYLGRKEKKKIQSLIADLPLSPKEAGQLQGRVYLCPSCTNRLKSMAKKCPSCNLAFKTRTQAIIRTILIPGGGYFYGRYPMTGSALLVAEIALIAAFVNRWMTVGPGDFKTSWPLIAIAGIFLTIKVIGAYHSSEQVRYHIPKKKDFTMRKV